MFIWSWKTPLQVPSVNTILLPVSFLVCPEQSQQTFFSFHHFFPFFKKRRDWGHKSLKCPPRSWTGKWKAREATDKGSAATYLKDRAKRPTKGAQQPTWKIEQSDRQRERSNLPEGASEATEKLTFTHLYTFLHIFTHFTFRTYLYFHF